MTTGHEHDDTDTHGHADHGHDHAHTDHGHAHGGDHSHPTGFKGFVYGLFVPHSHDDADSIDDAMEANSSGIRALKISLLILLATTVLQAVVVVFGGSVALLADTIHNFSDALTAVPLWVAFVLGRRAASRRYTYGLGRAEDLAGLFIVFVVALSAIVAAWQSIDRIIHPQPIGNIGWVIAAGIVVFLGNEVVAVYRIRVGQRIGSAALVADGIHARTDGFTSLAVVAGGVGVLLGFPLADPIVGLIISAAIFVLLIGTVRSVGRRLLDGVDPELVDKVTHALGHVKGIDRIDRIRLRWNGHRLEGDAILTVDATASRQQLDAISADANRNVRAHLPNVDEFLVSTRSPENNDAPN